MTQPTFKELVRKIKGLLKVADKYDLGNISDLLSDDKTNYIIKPDGTPHNLTDNIKSVNSVKPELGNNSITIPTIAKIVDETGTEHNITKVGQKVVLNHIPSKTYRVFNENLDILDGHAYTNTSFMDLVTSVGIAIADNGKIYPLSVYNNGENTYLSIVTQDNLNNATVIVFFN